MTWESWLTVAVVAVAVVALAREMVPPSMAILGATVTLLVAGVLEPAEAFSGFSNPAPVSVAGLYVVAGAIERTGVLNGVIGPVLGSARGERTAMARLLVPAAGMSAVLNNTPIVAMLVPAVSRWAHRNGRSVSRYLMPLSFAALLGGTLTVIGTSTNLVVSGLLEQSGRDPFGFFEVGTIGLPVAIAGLILVIALAPIVLPERKPARRDIEGDVREFVLDMIVEAGGPLDGVTVEVGHLRHLAGVFLVQVTRGDRVIAPVAPTTELRGDDHLRFVGLAGDVIDLHNTRGLIPEAEDHIAGFDTTQQVFYEVVVGPASPLVGHSLKQMDFRSRYQAAVVAAHRADHRVEGKLGELRLRIGDTLLIVASRAFRSRWYDRNDFLLVSRITGSEPARSAKGKVALAIGAGVVLAAATGLTGILEASLVGAFAVVALGVLTPNEAKASLDFDVLVVIASAFGLGAAIYKTGLADLIADGIITTLDGFGSIAVVIGLLLATMALTEMITNNAAAVLMFPIAMAAAAEIGIDPRAMAIVVAIGASASFLTPIGYQTNTMVWGPGGYRFSDYARLGTALSLATIVTVAVMVPIVWPS
ncbi:SLC13 family permease [bacterium]|nr:SLC13 family permease [bacterium]